jgi:hypothetical protein
MLRRRGWRQHDPFHPTFGHAVWGTAPGSAWVGDDRGGVSLWDGSTPSVSDDIGSQVHDIWGTGANDVWAVGESGATAHWDGTSWSSAGSLNGGEINALYAVWGSASNDVWAVGRRGAMARWDGSMWSVVAAGL